jgi:hypothetical protein
MPIRLGKGMLKVLRHMAKNQQRGIRVNFLIDPLTSRERKAIRQLIRAHEIERKPLPNLTKNQFGGVVHARLFPRDWKPLGNT